jgi:hypothetical protein
LLIDQQSQQTPIEAHKAEEVQLRHEYTGPPTIRCDNNVGSINQSITQINQSINHQSSIINQQLTPLSRSSFIVPRVCRFLTNLPLPMLKITDWLPAGLSGHLPDLACDIIFEPFLKSSGVAV